LAFKQEKWLLSINVSLTGHAVRFI